MIVGQTVSRLGKELLENLLVTEAVFGCGAIVIVAGVTEVGVGTDVIRVIGSVGFAALVPVAGDSATTVATTVAPSSPSSAVFGARVPGLLARQRYSRSSGGWRLLRRGRATNMVAAAAAFREVVGRSYCTGIDLPRVGSGLFEWVVGAVICRIVLLIDAVVRAHQPRVRLGRLGLGTVLTRGKAEIFGT